MSGKLHDLALEALPEGLLAVDGDGRVQTVNAAAAAMLGVVPERLMGHRLFDVVGALPAFTRLVELVETGLKASAVIEQAGGRRILAMIRSFGGWGLVFGDEASGAWLGRAILSRALRASLSRERKRA